jgi:hypothetical protein
MSLRHCRRKRNNVELKFPKIVREVALSEYAPELQQVLFVWVNPPVSLLEDIGAAFKRIVDSQGTEGTDEYLVPLSAILSQGEEPSRWTPGELKGLRDGSADTDPSFWMWLQNRIMKEISEHRYGIKKA